MVKSPRLLTLAALVLSFTRLNAQARFDLAGPKVDVRVTRGGETLPIASVPNLQAGDRIWVHPDLPATQSVHYLLIAAFLRGTTNPPPDHWFTRIETWDKKVREEGVTVTVPQDAQQAVLFLAPETGGDFGTLRGAVKGRPGVFVRASQDLTQAGFDQARVDAYTSAIKQQLASADEATLVKHSNLLAATLELRPNADCFKRPPQQQYDCLIQTGPGSLLDDGHSLSVVAALSSGDNANLINQVSYTQQAGGGAYSLYVGTIVDFVHIMSGLHTAKYQYIPAIASPKGDTLNLRLNTPPSFNNPKSVLVISLPTIQPAQLPPLHATDPNAISCLEQPKLVFPIEGAPLVFSTGFAHDLVLEIESGDRKTYPLAPDAFHGGLALNPSTEPRRRELPTVPVPGMPEAASTQEPAPSGKPSTLVTGTIKGKWGFDDFTGPTLTLQQLPGMNWKIVATPQTPATLIAGQDNHLQLTATGTACIQTITAEPGNVHAVWKLDAATKSATPEPQSVDLTLNLQQTATPGNVKLAIQQYGEAKPDEVAAKTFSDPAKIHSVSFHAGDTSATISGSSLDQVRQLTIDNLTFNLVAATEEHASGNAPELLAAALPSGTKPPNFKPGDRLVAHVSLRDDRTIDVPVTVAGPRPQVNILSRRISSPGSSPIRLANADDLPLGSQMMFSLKSPGKFPRSEKIEIANADDSQHTQLEVENGTLVLQDAHTIFATFDPLKIFGPSTFGPLRLRAVSTDGTDGDWLPLTTIVRLPQLDQLRCPADATQPCTLSGSSLFLIDAIAADSAFTRPDPVPEGYVDPTLTVPHPDASGILYMKLRDDPAAIQQAMLPIQPTPDATAAIQRRPAPRSTPAPAPTALEAQPAAPAPPALK
jgi:hypothetical protein